MQAGAYGSRRQEDGIEFKFVSGRCFVLCRLIVAIFLGFIIT